MIDIYGKHKAWTMHNHVSKIGLIFSINFNVIQAVTLLV